MQNRNKYSHSYDSRVINELKRLLLTRRFHPNNTGEYLPVLALRRFYMNEVSQFGGDRAAGAFSFSN